MKTTIETIEQMTWEKWQALDENERAAIRSDKGLSPQRGRRSMGGGAAEREYASVTKLYRR